MGRVQQHTSINGLALFVQLEDELGDYTEVSTSTTNSPEQILVLGLVGDESTTISYDDFYLSNEW